MSRPYRISTVYLASLMYKYQDLNVDNAMFKELWLNKYICELGYPPIDIEASWHSALKSAQKIVDDPSKVLQCRTFTRAFRRPHHDEQERS